MRPTAPGTSRNQDTRGLQWRSESTCLKQFINKLRAIELGVAQGDTVEQSCRKAAINVQTYYRWRSRYGGMTIAEA